MKSRNGTALREGAGNLARIAATIATIRPKPVYTDWDLRLAVRMRSAWHTISEQRRVVILGLSLCCAVTVQCHDATTRSALKVGLAADRPANQIERKTDEALLLLAADDPLGFLSYCREVYDYSISDYRAKFTKQERIKGNMRKEQVTEIRFREKPYSVDMRWISNPGKAKRVSYVAGRWVEDNRELAYIEPSGIFGVLVSGVKRDIHSAEAKEESRRTIDQFGLKNSLDMIIKYCEKAKGSPEYKLSFRGLETFHDRLSFTFERQLPYDGEQGGYPDRRLLFYIDCEWLVPTGVLAYADIEKRELLGRYVFTDLQFNTGLTDADF